MEMITYFGLIIQKPSMKEKSARVVHNISGYMKTSQSPYLSGSARGRIAQESGLYVQYLSMYQVRKQLLHIILATMAVCGPAELQHTRQNLPKILDVVHPGVAVDVEELHTCKMARFPVCSRHLAFLRLHHVFLPRPSRG